MKKIVFFNSSNEAGGPARVISIWANYFIKSGYQIEIVTNINREPFFFLDPKIELSSLGIDKLKQKNLFKTFWKLYKCIDKRSDQFLIFNKAIYIPYLYILKKIGLINSSLRLIYFNHGASSELKIYYNNLKLFLMNNTFDKIISSHNHSQNSNLKIRKSYKRRILDNIFFINSYQSILKKNIIMPNPIGFYSKKIDTNKSKIILAVGRLDYIKGFDLLIKAWRLLFIRHPDWKIQIIGSGKEEGKLKKLILDNNIENIYLIPEQRKIKDFYNNASIYVMSSREEGFPMVLLEAMEFGLPIISFANEGAKAIIEHNNTGILVKLRDVEALSEAISRMIENPKTRKRISSNAKLKAKEYDIDCISSKWENVFKD